MQQFSKTEADFFRSVAKVGELAPRSKSRSAVDFEEVRARGGIFMTTPALGQARAMLFVFHSALWQPHQYLGLHLSLSLCTLERVRLAEREVATTPSVANYLGLLCAKLGFYSDWICLTNK